MSRLSLLAVLLLAVAVLGAGCGADKAELRMEGETEGLQVDLGNLMYQVQLSRQLNPNDPEDSGYLTGLSPETEPPTSEETWFAIFIRVQNVTDQLLSPAEEFEIVDTEERVYERVMVDPAQNPFAYRPVEVEPEGILPGPNTIAGQGVVGGLLLLFKVQVESLQNRPLEFVIRTSRASGEAVIDLDV